MASMSRSGEFHVTKECSEFTGKAGDHCTITEANVDAIVVGSQIVYADAAGPATLDTNVVLNAGPGNTATGHVTLDLGKGTGTVMFSGGTGTLAGFHAQADVSADAAGLWHWEGTYNFSEMGEAVAAVGSSTLTSSQ
jgi:hypothetical protein